MHALCAQAVMGGEGELILRPSRWPRLVLCAVLLSMGTYRIVLHQPVGWLIIAVGAVVGSGILSVAAHSSLRLDEGGVTVRFLSKEERYLWRDIKEISMARMAGRRWVGFDMASSYQGAPAFPAAFRAKVHVPFDIVLPGTFGRSAPELVRLLEEWRAGHHGA
jgi:hypothetical protein